MPSDRAYADLTRMELIGRRLAELPRGHLDFLLVQGGHTRGGGQAALASRVGSRHKRMAYLRSPKIITSPTPLDAFNPSPRTYTSR